MRRPDPDDIAVSVVVPVPRAFGLDLISLALGNPLSVLAAEALAPVLTDHPYEMPMGGKPHLILPVALADGQKGAIPIGRFGHIGIGNEGGQLLLLVPADGRGFVEQAIAGQLADGRARSLGTRAATPPFTKAMSAYMVRPMPQSQWMIELFGIKVGFVFP